jgi:hypothetical protein
MQAPMQRTTRHVRPRAGRSVLLLSLLLLLAPVPGLAGPPRTEGSALPAIEGPLPRPDVLATALRAAACGRAVGLVRRPVVSVIDYSLPSSERRLWVIDLPARRVLFHELVAHGRNSGLDRARRFSNEPGSKESSLGLFRTDETFDGEHGYALRLDGLEPGVNDRARERAIVVHAARYVSEEFVAEWGRLGRSWGCPAVSPAVERPLVDAIQGGSALVAYYPDRTWLASSPFLHCSDGPGAPPSAASLLPSPFRALTATGRRSSLESRRTAATASEGDEAR